MHRVVDATLHAETLALNTSLAEVGWLITLMHEFVYSKFRLDEWERWCEQRRVLALSGCGEEGVDLWLKNGLCVVDAKSLYDYLQKESTGGKEKRCATQVQIIRQAMNAMGCKIRWIDHPAMVVDGMTKRKARLDLIMQLLREGSVLIVKEETTMAEHQARSAAGIRPVR